MASLFLAASRGRRARSESHIPTHPHRSAYRLAPLTQHLLLAGLMLAPVAGWAQGAPASVQTLPTVQVESQAEAETRAVKQLSANDLAAQGTNGMADVVRYQPLVSAPGVASGSGNVWDGSGNTGYRRIGTKAPSRSHEHRVLAA